MSSRKARPIANVFHSFAKRLRSSTGRNFRLADLPNELLLEIGIQLGRTKDAIAIAAVNRRFHGLFGARVYELAVSEGVMINWKKYVPTHLYIIDTDNPGYNFMAPHCGWNSIWLPVEIPLLHWLVLMGRVDAVRAFWKTAGAEQAQHSALCLAVVVGHLEVFDFLMQSSMKKTGEKERFFVPYTPEILQDALCFASALDRVEMVQKLLQTGVDVNGKGRLSNFPGQRDFKQRGMPLEKRREGAPIHWAAFNGRADVLTILLQAGADTSVTDNDLQFPKGQPALALAASSGNVNAVRVLLESSTEFSPNVLGKALSSGISNKDIECARLLINAGADAAVPAEEKDQYPIYLAIMNDDVECVRLLIDCGASINVKDSIHRESSLFFAARYRASKCIRLLFDLGALSRESDAFHGRSLLRAAIDGQDSHFRVTEELWDTLDLILERWPVEDRLQVDSEIDRVAEDVKKRGDVFRNYLKAYRFGGPSKARKNRILKDIEQLDRQYEFILARRHGPILVEAGRRPRSSKDLT